MCRGNDREYLTFHRSILGGVQLDLVTKKARAHNAKRRRNPSAPAALHSPRPRISPRCGRTSGCRRRATKFQDAKFGVSPNIFRAPRDPEAVALGSPHTETTPSDQGLRGAPTRQTHQVHPNQLSRLVVTRRDSSRQLAEQDPLQLSPWTPRHGARRSQLDTSAAPWPPHLRSATVLTSKASRGAALVLPAAVSPDERQARPRAAPAGPRREAGTRRSPRLSAARI